MSGSGSREGRGRPPWDTAPLPVSEPDGAQPLPGLGATPGQDGASRHNGSSSPGSDSGREQASAAGGGSGPGGTGGPRAAVRRETGSAQPSEETAGRAATEGDGTPLDGAIRPMRLAALICGRAREPAMCFTRNMANATGHPGRLSGSARWFRRRYHATAPTASAAEPLPPTAGAAVATAAAACSPACPKVGGMGRSPIRLGGQIITKARPTTALSGIVPLPGSSLR